ncbi:MAG: squalene/phytoene synthase family protein [Pseudomonadota bacterium]
MTLASLAPVPHGADRSPQEVVDSITFAARSSFSLGMSLIARPRRQAMRAVYAFCRVVDDIADGDPPADTMDQAEKLALLDDWRGEIDLVFAGRPVSSIGKALLEPVSRYDLPKAEFVAMIEGMEVDARGPVIAPDLEALRGYTRRVAGSVGCLSMRIFGAHRGPESDRFALALADAIQLTNILRDVEEDAEIGRLYLPCEILDAQGIPHDPVEAAQHKHLPQACAKLGAIARQNYEDAIGMLSAHSHIATAPARAMMGVYRRYLDLMEQANWQRPAPRMTKGQKLRYGLQAVIAG